MKLPSLHFSSLFFNVFSFRTPTEVSQRKNHDKRGQHEKRIKEENPDKKGDIEKKPKGRNARQKPHKATERPLVNAILEEAGEETSVILTVQRHLRSPPRALCFI